MLKKGLILIIFNNLKMILLYLKIKKVFCHIKSKLHNNPKMNQNMYNVLVYNN
jgi:hypothetical protein